MKRIELCEHQKLTFELLIEFDRICRKQDLRYSLFYGTMLGAVRHHGFIPWDDDIDVVMPRTDYDKLLKCSTLFEEPYQLCDHRITEGYIHPIAKLMHKGTILKETINRDTVKPLGLYIDIFPADKVPIEKKAYEQFHKKCFQNARKLAFSVLRYRKSENPFKNMMKRFVLGYYHMRGANTYLKSYDKLIEESKALDSYVNKIIAFPEPSDNVILDEDFDDLIEIEFEEKSFKMLSCYDRILSASYGDYMKLPPLEDRCSNHDIEVYWK